MSIHDAIKSSTDPRELRIAIALADIRLNQLALSAQMDDASLEARADVVGHFVRAGLYCAELARRSCPRLACADVGNDSAVEFFAGAFIGALLASVFAMAT